MYSSYAPRVPWPPAFRQALALHVAYTGAAPRRPASRPASRTDRMPPFSTWQGANSLSNANKLLIRCAWAGTSIFPYGSSFPENPGHKNWGRLGSCPN